MDTLKRDLKEMDRKLTEAVDSLIDATTAAERDAAKAAVEQLQQAKAELDTRMDDLRAAPVRAVRTQSGAE